MYLGPNWGPRFFLVSEGAFLGPGVTVAVVAEWVKEREEFFNRLAILFGHQYALPILVISIWIPSSPYARRLPCNFQWIPCSTLIRIPSYNMQSTMRSTVDEYGRYEVFSFFNIKQSRITDLFGYVIINL